jgi:4-hydroxybenzoate polyprenyltransferase
MSRGDTLPTAQRPASLIAAYARERLTSRAVNALVLALAGVAMLLETQRASTMSFAFALVPTWLFVMAFRVWDDLADRAHDRLTHPARVIVRSAATTPFVILDVSLFAAAIALLPRNGLAVRVMLVAATMAMAAMVYLRRSADESARLRASYAVLAKYPLIACAVVPGPLFSLAALWPRRVLVLAGAYAAIAVFETVDDVELRTAYIKSIRP